MRRWTARNARHAPGLSCCALRRGAVGRLQHGRVVRGSELAPRAGALARLCSRGLCCIVFCAVAPAGAAQPTYIHMHARTDIRAYWHACVRGRRGRWRPEVQRGVARDPRGQHVCTPWTAPRARGRDVRGWTARNSRHAPCLLGSERRPIDTCVPEPAVPSSSVPRPASTLTTNQQGNGGLSRRNFVRLCPAQGPSPSPRVHRSLMKTDAGDGFESLSECHLRGNRSGSYFFFFVFLSSFFLCGKRSTSAGFELPEREEGWTERAGRALWRPPRPTAGRACAMCMEQAHAASLVCGCLTRAAAVGAL